MEAVDPVEILVGDDGTVREEPIPANPWLRFLGRMTDYALFCLFLLLGRRLLGGSLPLGHYESAIPFEYFAWIPVEAALLAYFGNTPGKWLVGTQIGIGRRIKLGYGLALHRAFKVWFRGLGMGIPLLLPFCLLYAYNRLRLLQYTSWDRDDNFQISHRRVGRWRLIIAIIVAIGGLSFYFSAKHKEIQGIIPIPRIGMTRSIHRA